MSVRASPALAACCLVLGAACAAAQQPASQPSGELEQLVSGGLVEALEARLAGGRTPDDMHLLAKAATNKARRERQPAERSRAGQQAAARYERWIKALEAAGDKGLADTVRLAAARVEYAGMILSVQAAPQLDEYEITAGRRGDRELLSHLLQAARAEYEKAGGTILPLFDDLRTHEEELLAAGVYDVLVQTRLDATLNLGWANYYLGVLETEDNERRRDLFGRAQRKFQDLIDGGQAGPMRPHCYLGLAMAQRELGHFADAEKSFGYMLDDELPPVLAAQGRYELARLQLQAGKFDEARASLRPLVDKDLDRLAPDERPARLYFNLAQLWEANSYLLEAEATRHKAEDSVARSALLQKAQRQRSVGLSKMRQLARRGGPWPGLVQLYVSTGIDLNTPAGELSTLELLYAAGALSEVKRYQQAAELLTEAARREEGDATLAGDVLFELGRCQYQLKQERPAAETFARLAAQYRNHPQAGQAATFAYELWGRVAEKSRKPDDYLQLAAVLRNLLESFADHPKRDEVKWLLPVALSLAGRFADAGEEFAKVPPTAARWEEAQYRRAVCAARAVEAERSRLDAETYRQRALQAAEGLLRYAADAAARAGSTAGADQAARWSAQARLAAAELLIAPDVAAYHRALAAVEALESQQPGAADNQLAGRVLAVRIRAYRGLRDFDRASQIVGQFLRVAQPEQIGGTLASLAQGVQEEVRRLLDAGEADAARELARGALATFEELENWVRADRQRAGYLDAVLASRAQMHYLAGQYSEALKITAGLLEKSPRNGHYQHMRALMLTARLDDSSSVDAVREAQEAWAVLLSDGSIRQRAPERYWEARYHWLALALRLGQGAEVERAITQERIWWPDLGGPSWKPKLEELLVQARVAQGLPAETQPATCEAGG